MYPVSILSIVCAGGVYAATGSHYAPNDAAYQFKLVRPKVILCSEAMYEATKVVCQLSGIESSKIYVFRSHDICNAETGVSLIHKLSLHWNATVDPNTTAFILFTSGTSGFPKLATLLSFSQ